MRTHLSRSLNLVGLILVATMIGAWAGPPMTHDQHVVNGIYNLGDALWAVFGALVLLAISVFVAGLKIANAIRKPHSD